MALTKAQKEVIASELAEKMKEAKSIVFADYQGLTVKELKELRTLLAASGVSFKVVKKTLIKIAAKQAGFDADLGSDVVEGPIGAALSMEDELAAAKIIHQFSKKHTNLKLRGSLFEGRVLSLSDTKELALIPSKEELLSQLVYLLKSPISGFHGVLNNTVTGFVRVLDAIREKQEQSA